MSSAFRRLLLSFPPVLLAVACSRSPKDLRVWQPADHDRTEENRNAQAAPNTGDQNADLSQPAKMLGVDQVVLVTWRQNCTRCHGMLGRGDGPQGAMFGARDLSDPAWQKSVTDAQLSTAITNGKGKMPAFNNLPASTVTGLVHLVRMMNADRGAAQAQDNQATGGAGGAPTKPAKTTAKAHPPRKRSRPDKTPR